MAVVIRALENNVFTLKNNKGNCCHRDSLFKKDKDDFRMSVMANLL